MNADSINVIETSDREVNTESWMHIVFSYDSKKTRLYENGYKIAYKTNSGDIASADQPINIGGPAELEDNRYFEGLIDEVRIYNRSLSDNVVFELYQWGTRGKNLKEAIDTYDRS